MFDTTTISLLGCGALVSSLGSMMGPEFGRVWFKFWATVTTATVMFGMASGGLSFAVKSLVLTAVR